MSYFSLALICAVIGVIPTLLTRKSVSTAVIGTFGFIVLWVIFYFSKAAFLAPYFGLVPFMTVVLWTISTIFACFDMEVGMMDHDSKAVMGFIVPVLFVLLLLGSHFFGSGIFRAGDYATAIGPIEQKVWTRDSQPKDVRHVRLIGDDTAIYIAKKWVGSLGAIGSQYQLDTDELTLQRVNGDLKYVIPLDFSGFGQWTKNGESGVPAYMIVDAQDAFLQPTIVSLPEGQRLVYTPAAFFGKNLERHLRQAGTIGEGFGQTAFELDDQGHPWWVISAYVRTIGWGAPEMSSVYIVSPTTGAVTRYDPERLPAWVDRAMPDWITSKNLEYRGQYSGGWWNHFWSHTGLTKPETPMLIYGSGDQLEWVTGITSDTSNDDSLVGIAYTNSRTGKTTIYQVKGGATDTALQEAANANSYVKLNKLHAGRPQIYNIYGVMTAVVPLMNDTNAYQGTALVNVLDPQVVGVGTDTDGAASMYQEAIYRSGQQALPGKNVTALSVKGTVDRIRQDVSQAASQYYVHLKGVNRLFVVSSQGQQNVKIVITQPGDTVVIDYSATGDTKVPVRHFENLSVPLDESPIQATVSAAVNEKHAAAELHSDAEDIRKRVSSMSDDELVKSQSH